MAKLRITYSKSAIGYSKDQKATIRSLGLHKLNHIVIQQDTPAIRGMIFKVQHLVRVEEVGDDVASVERATTKRPIVRPAPVAAEDRATVAPRVVVDTPLATSLTADDELVAAEELDTADDLEAADDLAAVDGQASAGATDDDLTAIEGIGPKIAGVLREAGIGTFAQLAATDVAQLSTILQDANLRLASPESWPEQAALAAADDWEALKELQSQLKGGRRE